MVQRVVHIINSNIDSILMGISECQSIELLKKDSIIKSNKNNISKFINILKTAQKKCIFYTYSKNGRNFSIFSDYFNNIATIEDIKYIYDAIYNLNPKSCLILLDNKQFQIIKNNSVLYSTKDLNSIAIEEILNIINNDFEMKIKNLNMEKDDHSFSYGIFCESFQLSPCRCIKEVLKDTHNYEVFDFYV